MKSRGARTYSATNRPPSQMSPIKLKTVQPVRTSDAAWRLLGAVFQPVLRFADWGMETLGLQVPPKPPVMPEDVPIVEATPQGEIQEAIENLNSKKEEWVGLGMEERADLLKECRKNLVQVSVECSETATKAHGSFVNGIGEEMAGWIPVAVGLNDFETALRSKGEPTPAAVYQRPNGQYAVEVYPKGVFALLFGSMRGEVWIEKGKEPTQGATYKRKSLENGRLNGGVSLVLGAGNQISVILLDILHKLLVDDQVVIAKMNPQNSCLGTYVKRVLQPFIARGFVDVVYGGVPEASFICRHVLVNSIHLTGSVNTYNAIVWGGDPADKTQKVNEREVSAELGCVTPCIVAPGDWTDGEIKYHAKSIVAGLVQNSSHNCCGLEILVTSKNWSKRGKFMEAVKSEIDRASMQYAWYSGSQEKFAAFQKRFAKHGVLELGKRPDNDEANKTSPWMLVTGLSPQDAQTRTENWCGVLQEVCIPDCDDGQLDKFLEKAVEFANKECWGSLSCCVFIKPETQDASPQAFDRALEDLKYGSIVVNGPPTLGFSMTSLSWGAYPGNTPEDIESGNCCVHNALLLDHPEKSVLYVPWHLAPKPVWFHTLSNKDVILRKFMEFGEDPTLHNLLKLIPPMLVSQS